MNKTAVEWLEDKYKKLHIPIPKILFDHAKAMEKEQHKKTWSEGMFCETGDIQAFEQYYNETFKSE